MKRIALTAMALLLALTAVSVWAGSKPEQTATSSADRPPTWIADRLIKGRIFLENDGEALPTDQINSPVAQKIKELTGITIDWALHRSPERPRGAHPRAGVRRHSRRHRELPGPQRTAGGHSHLQGGP